jgi:hypothetical protein
LSHTNRLTIPSHLDRLFSKDVIKLQIGPHASVTGRLKRVPFRDALLARGAPLPLLTRQSTDVERLVPSKDASQALRPQRRAEPDVLAAAALRAFRFSLGTSLVTGLGCLRLAAIADL